ncbi:MAG: hypothetical protein IT174_00265 [Acidobacteria bacterium]|nr:hypothetical protein [Acidobacteriota bacterium]
MQYRRKRKSAKISDAVFRGKKGDHTFEVYPFGGEVPDEAAVFIFSRRKLHRSGHVSHAVSCIGETASAAAELKRHMRSKCVKINGSNVICLLRNENAKGRNSVLGDLTGARAFSCVCSVYEPANMKKPDALHLAAAKPPEPKRRRTPKTEKTEIDEAQIEKRPKEPIPAKQRSVRAASKQKIKAGGNAVKAKAGRQSAKPKPGKLSAAAAKAANAKLKTVKPRKAASPAKRKTDKAATTQPIRGVKPKARRVKT